VVVYRKLDATSHDTGKASKMLKYWLFSITVSGLAGPEASILVSWDRKSSKLGARAVGEA